MTPLNKFVCGTAALLIASLSASIIYLSTDRSAYTEAAASCTDHERQLGRLVLDAGWRGWMGVNEKTIKAWVKSGREACGISPQSPQAGHSEIKAEWVEL